VNRPVIKKRQEGFGFPHRNYTEMCVEQVEEPMPRKALQKNLQIAGWQKLLSISDSLPE
jgi:hypothetical protein